MKGRGLLGKGRYSAELNRVALSFRNRNESKVRRRACAAPQATRGKPSQSKHPCPNIFDWAKLQEALGRHWSRGVGAGGFEKELTNSSNSVKRELKEELRIQFF